MNISYFISVLTLYLNKEKESCTNLNIKKEKDEKIKVNFTMNNDLNETTSIFILYDDFMEQNNLQYFLQTYKGNLIIIDEKYEYDRLSETCYYCIILSNGRILSFKNFTLNEINNIRNLVYNIDYHPEEIKVVLDDNQKDGYYRPRMLLGQTGFASFLTLSVVILIIFNVFVLALWIFDNFI